MVYINIYLSLEDYSFVFQFNLYFITQGFVPSNPSTLFQLQSMPKTDDIGGSPIVNF